VLLALKVDVDTLAGTRHGVPRLVEALKKHRADATFLFSLGPDHTGRAITRVFRKGFLSKVQRTSVVSNYGLKTLLYGTLLPGPDIGRRCAETMRAVRKDGFEVGVHCWDHVRWQDHVAHKDAHWTEREMQLALGRFQEIFGSEARTWGAAGWQTNRHAAWVQEQRLEYASDTRGSGPFLPLWNGVRVGCVQLPTTLPTLDELVGLESDVVQALLKRTASLTTHHVFTAHAELEGGRYLAEFERLLAGWKAQGYDIVDMKTLYRWFDPLRLPRCEVVYGEVPGRSGTLALQGAAA